MVVRLSFRDAPGEFRAAALALRQVEQPVRRAVSQDMRTTMGPAWKSTLSQHMAGDPRDALLVTGARIAAGNPPALVTASGKRRWGSGGGLVPNDHWPGIEYGATAQNGPAGRRTYTRKRRDSRAHTVTRNVLSGHPRRQRNGRVIGPATRLFLPRVAAYWVQSVVRIVMDAAEKGR